MLGTVKDEPPAAVAQGPSLTAPARGAALTWAGRDEGMAVAIEQRNRTLKKE